MYRPSTPLQAQLWKSLSARLLFYTVNPLDDDPGENDPGEEPGEEPEEGSKNPGERQVLEIQDEMVLDSVAYHLVLDGAEEGVCRVFIRDAEGFEGTVACSCEPAGVGRWMVVLEETAENRMNGQCRDLVSLVYPLYVCFCSDHRTAPGMGMGADGVQVTVAPTGATGGGATDTTGGGTDTTTGATGAGEGLRMIM